MTINEELLAAVKEHATADVDFHFLPNWPKLNVFRGDASVDVLINHRTRRWIEDVRGYGPDSGSHEHDSASSAVYSAFLRARK